MKYINDCFDRFKNIYQLTPKIPSWKKRHSHLQAPLLANPKEYGLFLIILILCFTLSISLEYRSFMDFKNSGYKQDFSTLDATVLNQYKKSNQKGEYTVLKLKSTTGITFYTTTKEDIKNLTHRLVRVIIINKHIRFLDYLKGFYAFSIKLELLPQVSNTKNQIRSFITSQHDSMLASNFYTTLFLADTLSLQVRTQINALGIAHLMAISGFHYGVIGGLIFGLLYFPYYALQKRFFPYRNAYYDLSFIALIMGGCYLLLLDHSPSFLRAFMMALWGFILMINGIKVFSVTSLFLLTAVLIAVFPSLVFSIGFWFSVLGVFYILVFFVHYSPKRLLNIILLQIGIYLYMLPITHYFFAPFSPLSVLSIILTPLFTLFYPLSILSHMVGYGNVFDHLLQAFFALDIHVSFIHTPIYVLIPLSALSLGAIFNKKSFWALNLGCFAFFLYFLVIFLKQ